MRVLISILVFSLLSACGPDSGKEESGYVVPRAEPSKPVVVQENGYSITRGATRVQDMSVMFDPQTKTMTLKGKLEFLAAEGGSVETLPLDLKGALSADGFISLKNSRRDSPSESTMKVAAKATCLSEQGTCHSSFIDIYLNVEGLIYHHQIESHQDPKQDEPVKAEGKGETEDKNKEESKAAQTDEMESEGGADEVDGEPGSYIGSIADDIQSLLDLPPQKAEPKKGVSQAIGAVNLGRLENAKNMLAYQLHHKSVGYHIIRPQRLTHFASDELAYIIQKMGMVTQEAVPNYALSVGDLSLEKGGRLGRHKSHQSGLDADVAYYFDNKTFQGYFASAVALDKPHANWMLAEQWKLFKAVVETKLVDRIFIHATLKKALCENAIKNDELQKGNTESLAYQTLRRLIPDKDHNNHFHLRVKCSSAQIRCRQLAEPAAGSGCF